MARLVGGETAIRQRIRSAPGLSTAQAHALAGLLDAESSLAISPNNGNGWSCYCAINLRDDDRDILVDFRSKLGIGHLRPVSPRNGSRAQVCWTIGSKVECRLLVDLLDAHPLRGRKRAEYEIWREAVKQWSARSHGFAPGARDALARLAVDIRAARVYRDPDPLAPGPTLSDPFAAHYFAGFFSGEGSFGLGVRNARFVIKLRRDDRPLLEAFRRDFAMGSVRDVATPEPWSPAAVWHVVGARDVLRGIALFEAAPLLGRKARQYRAWRPGAEAVAHAILRRTEVDATTVAKSRRALTQATAYCAPRLALDVDHGFGAARIAHLDVLREWARATVGPLTCTGYEAVRLREHPYWPQRESIARAFGSWFEALRSAGLADRAVCRPSAR